MAPDWESMKAMGYYLNLDKYKCLGALRDLMSEQNPRLGSETLKSFL